MCSDIVTLSNGMDERLKVVEDLLKFIIVKVRKQEETINLIK